MKKCFILLGLLIIGLSACKKGDIISEQASIDDAKIQAYIKANNITATKDASGLYYQVLRPGTLNAPYPTSIMSNVQITSTGQLLNAKVFDFHAVTTYKLYTTIKGWQIGLTHINTGGRILLIVPSALAYGTGTTGGVPANSVLVFTIDLIGFN
jgi:FKBP-type peptidyl-prolyl cis-trans isomerase FkpA